MWDRKMRCLWIGVTVLIFINFSCSKNERPPATEGDQQNGIYRTRFPNDSISYEVPYLNGKIHGEAKEYFRSGQLFQLMHYIHGVKHGLSTKYYEDGTLSHETPYDSGRIHGVQKKFRKDATPAYEMPYHYDNPCVGLKEFGLNGELKKEYPTIQIETVDHILRDEKYSLIITMSNEAKNVTFYLGELKDGKCLIEDDVEQIYSEKFSGKAVLDYYIFPGMFMMKELNIIAKVKTVQGNYYLAQRKFNLAVENR